MPESNSKEVFKHLGSKSTDYVYEYNPSVLESFANKHPDRDYTVSLGAQEFTSLCPVTGQPDFAKIFINYIPEAKLVESKSLKLYLCGFRNHGAFHEDCVNIIMDDLVALMAPKYIEVLGIFTPRGGISIYPFCNHAGSDTYSAYSRQRLCDSMGDSVRVGLGSK